MFTLPQQMLGRRSFLGRMFAGAGGIFVAMLSPDSAKAGGPGLPDAIRRLLAARRRVYEVALSGEQGHDIETSPMTRACDELIAAENSVRALLGNRALAAAVCPEVGMLAILTRDGGWNEHREPGWPGMVSDPDPDYLEVELVPLASVLGLGGKGGAA